MTIFPSACWVFGFFNMLWPHLKAKRRKFHKSINLFVFPNRYTLRMQERSLFVTHLIGSQNIILQTVSVFFAAFLFLLLLFCFCIDSYSSSASSFLSFCLSARRETGLFWCLPYVWNLRAVIWFHLSVSSLILVPGPVAHSVFSFLSDFGPVSKSPVYFP